MRYIYTLTALLQYEFIRVLHFGTTFLDYAAVRSNEIDESAYHAVKIGQRLFQQQERRTIIYISSPTLGCTHSYL